MDPVPEEINDDSLENIVVWEESKMNGSVEGGNYSPLRNI